MTIIPRILPDGCSREPGLAASPKRTSRSRGGDDVLLAPAVEDGEVPDQLSREQQVAG